MQRLTKALLISGLVYPGGGHLFLHHYKTASIFIITFSGALYFFMHEILTKVQPLVDKVKLGQVSLTSTSIARELENHPIILDLQVLSVISYTLLLCWLIGMADLFRVNRIS